MTDFAEQTATNIHNILKYSLKLEGENKVLVIYDTDYELTRILTEGYKTALGKLKNEVKFYDFNEISKDGKDKVIQLFDQLSNGDLVVLIQSNSFRLDDFRIRLHLFAKKLKVIEHLHLHRNKVEVFDVYINSLKYGEIEQKWYQSMKTKLTEQLTKASKLEFITQKSTLNVGAVEIPKLNIGDYTGMQNIGGTFPIGEIFTEAKDFGTMNGSIYIYAFADQSFNISFHEPFSVEIQNGLVVGYGDNTPRGFIEVLDLVKSLERPLIREIGFGLNRAITKERPLGDITAYERILGVHMSLGEKHSVYKKLGITTHKTKFHVDLFLCVDEVKVLIDGKIVQITDGKF